MPWMKVRGPDFEEFPNRVRRRVEQMLKRSRVERMSGTKKDHRPAGVQNTPWYLKDPKEGEKAERYFQTRKQVEMISRSRCLREVKQAEEFVKSSGLEDDRELRDLLVEKYSEIGCIEQSRPMLDSRLRRNAFSWGVVIAAFAQNGNHKEAMHAFSEMVAEGVKPSTFTLCTVLQSCLELDMVEMIHKAVVLGDLTADKPFWNELINTYGRLGSVERARRVFEALPYRDSDAWAFLIAAYARQGFADEAVKLVRRMDVEGTKPKREVVVEILESLQGHPELLAEGRNIHKETVVLGLQGDVRVCTALLKMYSRCGSLREARMVFEEISSLKDTTSSTAMIMENMYHGAAQAALNIFKKLDAATCDDSTFAAAFDACTLLGDISEGRKIHAQLLQRSPRPSKHVQTALVNMYGKFGDVVRAVEAFNNSEPGHRDETLWKAMIGAYARRGYIKQVLESLREMDVDGLNPDEGTMLAVLLAFRDTGLTAKCRDYFRSIRGDRGLNYLPEHFECMADILVRKGKVEDAQELVKHMPFVPSPLSLKILNKSCSQLGDKPVKLKYKKSQATR